MGTMPVAVALLILALFGLAAGSRQAKKRGILTASFWQTFREYPRYRLRHLVSPTALFGAGSFLLGAGALNLYLWLRAFYAARLGHPLP